MGDRCWMRFQIAERDLETAREALHKDNGYQSDFLDSYHVEDKQHRALEADENDRGVLEFEMEEVNYGGNDALGVLANAKVVFFASNGAGGDYGEGESCSNGDGELYQVDCIQGAGPSVPLGDNDEPEPGPLKRAKEYLAAFRQVRAYFETIRAEFEAKQAADNALSEA